MDTQLAQFLDSTTWDPREIGRACDFIQRVVIEQTSAIDQLNFTAIESTDLERAFRAYDSQFFGQRLSKSLGRTEFTMSLSNRMTSAGGKTIHVVDRRTGVSRFEIRVSNTLLQNCFRGEDHRPITCSGVTCHHRFHALQRVLEHEIVHLAEILAWGNSSCRCDRFHSISYRFFRHTENTHQLITPRETAYVSFGIQPGMRVSFLFDGVQHVGIVNRITKRATVLVVDPQGQRYSDGKRYAKYYIPINQLTVLESDD